MKIGLVVQTDRFWHQSTGPHSLFIGYRSWMLRMLRLLPFGRLITALKVLILYVLPSGIHCYSGCILLLLFTTIHSPTRFLSYKLLYDFFFVDEDCSKEEVNRVNLCCWHSNLLQFAKIQFYLIK